MIGSNYSAAPRNSIEIGLDSRKVPTGCGWVITSPLLYRKAYMPISLLPLVVKHPQW